MNRLKTTSLLLVGKDKEKEYFEKYFKDVMLLKDNGEIYEFYQKDIFSIIFLDCDSEEKDALDVCKKIREHDHKTIMVLLSHELDEEKLYKALPLHLSGCILRPFYLEQVEDVLLNVNYELAFLSDDAVRLKEGYHFHIDEMILHTPRHKEIKLTKNEFKLLSLLIKAKDKLVTEEAIEHDIWEDDSFDTDCSSRLKNLLYNLRKKLPENSISNNYKLGYRLIYT
jgi:DNA-binding response OmpR family regulator